MRLGIFPTLGPYLLPHVVPKIRERFPRLELLLVEEKTEIVLKQLREGRLDAGVLALPIHDDQLHQRVPVRGTLPAGGARASPARATQAAQARRSRPIRACCCSKTAIACAIRRWRSASLPAPARRAGFRATSLETLRQMVAANVGVTLLPTLAVKPPVAQASDIRALIEFRGARAEPAHRDGLAQEFGDGAVPQAAWPRCSASCRATCSTRDRPADHPMPAPPPDAARTSACRL